MSASSTKPSFVRPDAPGHLTRRAVAGAIPSLAADRGEAPLDRQHRLSAAQIGFLSSLRAGGRPTAACQDALTVGTLLRLHLVAWNEDRGGVAGRRRAASTFSLTPLGLQRLIEHDASRGPAGAGELARNDVSFAQSAA